MPPDFRMGLGYEGNCGPLKVEEPKVLPNDREIQTRDNEGALRFFESIKEAFDYANTTPSVWKVSWTDTATLERVRFVRADFDGGWRFELIEVG